MATKNFRRGSALTAGTATALLALTSCGGGGGDVDAFCDVLEDNVRTLESALDTNDPAEIMGEGMDAIASMFSDAADAAPEEIQEESETLSEAFNEINNMDIDLESMASMSPEEMAELEAQAEDLQERFSDIDTVAMEWGEYVDENCDIEEPA